MLNNINTLTTLLITIICVIFVLIVILAIIYFSSKSKKQKKSELVSKSEGGIKKEIPKSKTFAVESIMDFMDFDKVEDNMIVQNHN